MAYGLGCAAVQGREEAFYRVLRTSAAAWDFLSLEAMTQYKGGAGDERLYSWQSV